MSESRGIRLNNPGCIRRNTIVWDGQADTQTDPDFVTFIAPEWGLRAIVKILDSYQREGIKTVREAICRYAPPADGNPTATYVANVASECHVDADAPIVLSVYRVPLVRAIVKQESGSWPYTDQLLAQAIEMAEEEAA